MIVLNDNNNGIEDKNVFFVYDNISVLDSILVANMIYKIERSNEIDIINVIVIIY